MKFRFALALLALLVFASPAHAVAPSVAATNTTSEAANTTTHSINLPASIANGDLLVVVMGCRNFTSVNALTGWTELADVASSTSGLWVAYRRADGSEGATIAPVTAASCAAGATSYRITGHHASSNPEISTIATDTSGTNTNPNPAAVTASWGAEDNLFIAFEVHAAGTDTTADPTNYDPLIEGHGQAAPAGSAASSVRALTAASDDPGTFTIAGGNVWQAGTVVVRPSIASAAAGSLVNGDPLKSLVNGGLVR